MARGEDVMKMISGLSEEADGVVKELKLLLAALNASKGTGGKLVYEDALYENINELLESGTSLVQMLEENPSSLIFGKRKKKKADDEEESESSYKRTRFQGRHKAAN
ncbi:MAG: hypothetical protein HQL32_02950 [Planctomycetes bacterium]|nr:hypothetical protein [Planctomycetota bacterium]